MRTRILFVAAVLLFSVAPAQAADPLAGFYQQQLQWKKCTKSLDCATYKVPLDYRNPGGRSITITAARNKATGKARGAVVVNPGGPGGSGIDYIEVATDVVTPTIHRAFDLVSFDPRGLGRSTPLNCFTDAQTDAFLEVDQTPDDQREEQALTAGIQRLINSCRRADDQLMRHVSTVEVAKDMDILRALLGEPRLRYIGKSWGTALGQAYAAIFPTRTGLFVLDGAVDVKLPLAQASYQQAQAFESAADRFINWCMLQGKCVLGTSKAAAKQRLITFIAGLDTAPLKTKQRNRPLTEQQAWTSIIGPLYVAAGGWDWLNAALTTAIRDKDGSDLQDINDWFISRGTKGRYTDNGNTLIYAVNCLDRTGATSTASARSRSVTWSKTLPLLGRLMAWGDSACDVWPYSAQQPLDTLVVKSVPPMLILGTTHDPATPMRWARTVQQEIPKSVLVERLGDGHTAYRINSPCIDKVVDAYLMSKSSIAPQLPKEAKRCE